MNDEVERQRIDKWLFFARFVKSRTLAAKLAAGGKVRVNRTKIDQAAYQIKTGDVLTISLDRRIVVCRVLQPGVRRGPAVEARLLYEDLTPPDTAKPEKRTEPAAPAREPGSGRPTKKERRAIDKQRRK